MTHKLVHGYTRLSNTAIKDHLPAAILIFLAISIYSNTLDVPFLFDDNSNILAPSHIRMTEFSVENILGAARHGHLATRPISNISFALNYSLGGKHVAGYHIVNILIHAFCGVMLYYFISLTGAIYPSPMIESSMVPFFAAAIWLVHPVQTQTVTYIVQRMNSLAALFFIITLYLYAKGRVLMIESLGQRRMTETTKQKGVRTYSLSVTIYFCGAFFSGIMALGSKEISATLPFFIFLYEWFFFQDLRSAWLRRHSVRLIFALLILLLITYAYLGGDPLTKIVSMYGRRDFTMIQRVLTEFRVVIFYISLLFFPHPTRLNLEHDFSLSHSLTDPMTTAVSLMLILACCIFAVMIAKRERVVTFSILWFFGNLVIESSVIGLEIIFEHRLYLPSMLICLMTVGLCFRYMRDKRICIAFFSIVVVVFFIWTYNRNKVWKDEVTLLTDCIEKSPGKFRPRYNLGIALAEQGKRPEAIEQYRIALRIDPGYASLHTNLGLELFAQGEGQLAVEHYLEALRIRPGFVMAHLGLATALLTEGKLDQARTHCEQALRIQPSSAPAFNCLGNIYFQQGMVSKAIDFYSKAIRHDATYVEAANNLGVALIHAGRRQQAVQVLKAAIEIRPDYVDAKRNLEKLLRTEKSP